MYSLEKNKVFCGAVPLGSTSGDLTAVRVKFMKLVKPEETEFEL